MNKQIQRGCLIFGCVRWHGPPAFTMGDLRQDLSALSVVGVPFPRLVGAGRHLSAVVTDGSRLHLELAGDGVGHDFLL